MAGTGARSARSRQGQRHRRVKSMPHIYISPRLGEFFYVDLDLPDRNKWQATMSSGVSISHRASEYTCTGAGGYRGYGVGPARVGILDTVWGTFGGIRPW